MEKYFMQILNAEKAYSHLSNNHGDWNKRGGGAKVAKSINVEVGINVEGGIFWKKIVHKCNKLVMAFSRDFSNL
jgi:hypothetical protein